MALRWSERVFRPTALFHVCGSSASLLPERSLMANTQNELWTNCVGETALTGQKAWGAPGGRQGTQRRRSMPDHCIGETTHTRECTGRKEEKTRGTNTTERYLRPLRPAGRAASLLPFRFLLKTVTDEVNGAVEEEESQMGGTTQTGTRGQSGQQWSLGESRSRHPSTGCFKQR